MIARRVLVSGLVQGVSFRWHSCEQARRVGATGWVRNLDDGRVEAHVQGDPAAVEELVGWMRTGPRGARVESLTAEDATADPGLTSFALRR